jgi:Rps23 Pro-64 3,4-dihydroxylase Tpa1-like proline 4-hydroxylase
MTEIRSSRYRDSLRRLTGIDLRDCVLEARLDRYSVGCWVEPHFDRPDNGVTHLFYFNDPWQVSWNGEFRVLRGSNMENHARRVFPYLGTSVIMVRSERSWHGVPPVNERCPHDRLSLLVQFVKPARPRTT